jgi:hypothetical protein
LSASEDRGIRKQIIKGSETEESEYGGQLFSVAAILTQAETHVEEIFHGKFYPLL